MKLINGFTFLKEEKRNDFATTSKIKLNLDFLDKLYFSFHILLLKLRVQPNNM